MAKEFTWTALIVEDDALMRWALSESLVEAGYAVQQAATARQALMAVAAAFQPFDVVLLDYMLPDSTDLQLIEAVRRLSPTSEVVMITSYGSPGLVESAIEAGADRVMTKPVEMEAFTTSMRRVPAFTRI